VGVVPKEEDASPSSCRRLVRKLVESVSSEEGSESRVTGLQLSLLEAGDVGTSGRQGLVHCQASGRCI
jgi:hypothetical protein